MLLNSCVELVQGDDYLAADGRAVTFTGAGQAWPSAISSAKLLMWPPANCGCDNTPALEVDGVYTAPTATQPARVTFDVHRAASLKLAAGIRLYTVEVKALLASGSAVTLERCFGTVLAGAL
jgi:hypothetical protein